MMPRDRQVPSQVTVSTPPPPIPINPQVKVAHSLHDAQRQTGALTVHCDTGVRQSLSLQLKINKPNYVTVSSWNRH